MLRHEALRDLSRDHHVALLHARRLRGEDRRVDFETERGRFARYLPAILEHHFAEEQALIPFLVDPYMGDRLVRGQAAVLESAAYLAAGDRYALADIGEAVRGHARFCEGLLFEHVQKHADMAAVAVATSAVRKARRPDAFGPDSAEICFL